jgi:type II secretory pathway pseudopilin PulG
VSLLEVLFSIGILMVGLLGVAAMIPAGRLEMAQAGQADRSSACARAAIREIKIRGILNPNAWIYPNGSRVVQTNMTDPMTGRTYAAVIPCGPVFFIDPLFIAENIDLPDRGYTQNPDIGHVPYLPMSVVASNPQFSERMVRVGLDVSGLTETAQADVTQRRNLKNALKPVYGEIFTWHDDLAMHPPTEHGERPRSLELAYNPKTSRNIAVPWPLRAEDIVSSEFDSADPPVALKTEIEGDYSWAAMVVPKGERVPIDLDNDGVRDSNEWFWNIQSDLVFSVSIVVFYKRSQNIIAPDLADPNVIPGERFVLSVQFPGAGWGGGDVLLSSDNRASLEFDENDWLLLPFAHYLPNDDRFTPFQWYRVVATDQEPQQVSSVWQRYVTLKGADYQFDYNNNHVVDQKNAVILSDVIGVYNVTVPAEDVY